METIKQILMQRDNMTEKEADNLIADARADMYYRLDHNIDANDICQEYFGLEPDFLLELLNAL